MKPTRSTVVMALMTAMGPLSLFMNWPCAADHHGEGYWVSVSTYTVVSATAWMSAGSWRQTLFRVALLIQSIYASALSHTWCFGKWSLYLFVAFVLVGHCCALQIAAPKHMFLQLTCTFVWTISDCRCLRIPGSREASLRRLYDGQFENNRYLKLIVVVSLSVLGVFGLALLALTKCRCCCCRERAPRIEVAEAFAVEDRNSDLQGIVLGAVCVEPEDDIEVSRRTDDIQRRDTDADSASDQDSLVFSHTAPSSGTVEISLWSDDESDGQ